MDDHQYDKIQRDNAEVLHVVESPFRFLMRLVIFLGWFTLAVGILFVYEVGWIVDIGPRSQHDRAARAEYQVQQLKHYNGESDDLGREWAQYEVDFRVTPDLFLDVNEYPYRDESANHFWPDDSLPWNESFLDDGYPVRNHRMKAFATKAYPAGRHGIPYCVQGIHPDSHMATYFDSSLTDWGTRWKNVRDRKAARMQRDYEIAAMMTASLRSTIARLKLHRPVPNGPREYCDTSQGDPAYRRALVATVLQHAPVVRIKYISIDPANGDLDAARSQYQAEIMGFCLLPDACTQPLLWGTTYMDDLFAPDAPLTDEQMTAERTILTMTTEEFWLQAARENGITDQASVKEAHRRALLDLNREFITANFEI